MNAVKPKVKQLTASMSRMPTKNQETIRIEYFISDASGMVATIPQSFHIPLASGAVAYAAMVVGFYEQFAHHIDKNLFSAQLYQESKAMVAQFQAGLAQQKLEAEGSGEEADESPHSEGGADQGDQQSPAHEVPVQGEKAPLKVAKQNGVE